MVSLLPTIFLPHLPRTQSTFSPIVPAELLAHISVLRRLYRPPVHGGLRESDSFYEEEDEEEEKIITGCSLSDEGPLNGDEQDIFGLGAPINIPPTNGSRSNIDKSRIEEEGSDSEDTEEEDEGSNCDIPAHLDQFERDWAQKWLEGLFRRAQTWIEENDPGEEEDLIDGKKGRYRGEDGLFLDEVEMVLRDATAALAMMAGTSAAGSLTRHLLFPVHPDLAPALRTVRKQMTSNPDLSPETQTFLASLSTSPVSPLMLRRLTLTSPTLAPTRYRRTSTAHSYHSDQSLSPTLSTHGLPSTSRTQTKIRRRPAIPVLLHDAPMGDHLSVGVQTWGSAILLGREMALRPDNFGLRLPDHLKGKKGGLRILELGAGTGLLSILCRKLLDIRSLSHRYLDATSTDSGSTQKSEGLVVATDFLPSVLDNLKICVDLNFPPTLDNPDTALSHRDNDMESGIHIAKLDWTTFPGYMESKVNQGDYQGEEEEMGRFLEEPFDLVLASDCVYDPTHAKMLRDVARWVLRIPEEGVIGDQGGTFHILSPLRPTFAPELESIDTHFPTLSTYIPLNERKDGDGGEGLGKKRGLKLGVRGDGKRSVRGRKGEGRVDETLGYWWWEVGWG